MATTTTTVKMIRTSTAATRGAQSLFLPDRFSPQHRSIARLISTGTTPFYGRPRPVQELRDPSSSSSSTPLSSGASALLQNVRVAVESATTAFRDPTRADAVAALGEVTGHVALQEMKQRMENDDTGRRILSEKPLVSKDTLPIDELIASSSQETARDPHSITFGQAYGAFLKGHGFDPDERSAVKHIEDPELAYIMMRYRQVRRNSSSSSSNESYDGLVVLRVLLYPVGVLVSFGTNGINALFTHIVVLTPYHTHTHTHGCHQNHDFWHVLTGLPPTVLGELGIKWLELLQTGLPVAALSATAGSLRLDSDERKILNDYYFPWAVRVNDRAPFLMNVYYEEEFDTPLKELRDRLGVEAAPEC